MTVCRPLDFFDTGKLGVLNASYVANYSTLSERAVATAEQCARLCLDYRPPAGSNFSDTTASKSCVAFNFGGALVPNATNVMNGMGANVSYPMNNTNATAATTPERQFWCILHSLTANTTTLLDNTTIVDTGLTSAPNHTVVYHQREYPGCVPELVRSVREFCMNNSDHSAMTLSPMPYLPPVAVLPPNINVTSTVHIVDDDCPILRVSAASMRAAEGGDLIAYNLSFETEPRASGSSLS